jgi:hypothetical protein
MERSRVEPCLLEAALKGCILFHVLAILVEGGRPHTPQLAPRQHRLQQVGGVHGALRLAGAQNQVDLVNEQNAAGEHKNDRRWKIALD